MPLDRDGQAQLLAWIRDKRALGACACGANSWHVADSIVTMVEIGPNGVPVHTGPAKMAAVAHVTCGDCARMEFFNAVVIGLATQPDL